jgi:nucleotide-binding universal stress UspA family protein
VVLLHVVDTEGGPELRMGTSTDTGVRLQIGQDIVTELRRMGEARGVRISAEVLMGGSVTANVIQRAGRSVDLMIIGTHVRSGSHRVFLGPRVEHMLRELPCSVILLNT